VTKFPLILIPIFIATQTFAGNDCQTPVSSADGNFAMVNATDDIELVSFCEPANSGNGTDYIIDFLMLGTENNQTKLFIHEFIATDPKGSFDNGQWYEVDKDLSGDNLTGFRAQRKGGCKIPGDFTRSVNTGAGLGGTEKKANKKHKRSTAGRSIEIDLCGHGKDSQNNVLIKYTYTGL
jgi:hypothetical protein